MPLRYAGVAAVVTLWISVGTGLYRTGLDLGGDRPLSYLGTIPTSASVFRGGLIVAAVLMAGFSWFVYGWFSARRSFLVVFLVGLVGQVVAAVVLVSGAGSSHGVHTVAGLVLGASLPLFMWRFAAGLPPGGPFGHGAGRKRTAGYGLFWLETAACAIGVALSMAGWAPVAEIVPALVFHLWVVVITAWSTVPAAAPQRQSAAGTV